MGMFYGSGTEKRAVSGAPSPAPPSATADVRQEGGEQERSVRGPPIKGRGDGSVRMGVSRGARGGRITPGLAVGSDDLREVEKIQIVRVGACAGTRRVAWGMKSSGTHSWGLGVLRQFSIAHDGALRKGGPVPRAFARGTDQMPFGLGRNPLEDVGKDQASGL